MTRREVKKLKKRKQLGFILHGIVCKGSKHSQLVYCAIIIVLNDNMCFLTEKYGNYDTVFDLLAFLRMSHFLRLGRRQRSSMLGTHS